MLRGLSSVVLTSIFWCNAIIALLADNSHADRLCSADELHLLRTKHFQELIKANRLNDAISSVNDYLLQHDCFTSEPEEYLWARSDLALAHLKNNEPGACLEIIETEQFQYYGSPLKEVGSKKIHLAFETNRRLCEAARAKRFPKAAAKSCRLGKLPATLPLDSPVNPKFKDAIGSVVQSIEVPKSSGFSCLAVIERKVTGDAGVESIQDLFGIKPGAQPDFIQLIYDEADWCGEPKISLHHDAAKGGSSDVTVHIVSTLSPCLGGTGRTATDSYFSVEDGALKPRDLSKPVSARSP